MLAPHLRAIEVSVGQVICDAGAAVRDVYFPSTCVLSMLVLSRSGDGIETATIGREGAFGLIAGIQTNESYARCLVQMSGSAYRLPIEELKKVCDCNEPFRRVLASYVQALFIQVQQNVACNALHPVEARLARWLLTMRDRAAADVLPLTQEFLASMLGVTRTTETEAARELQAVGAIKYRRGTIAIVNPAELEAVSCECYEVVRIQFEKLLPET